jgi:hypothetical protein
MLSLRLYSNNALHPALKLGWGSIFWQLVAIKRKSLQANSGCHIGGNFGLRGKKTCILFWWGRGVHGVFARIFWGKKTLYGNYSNKRQGRVIVLAHYFWSYAPD